MEHFAVGGGDLRSLDVRDPFAGLPIPNIGTAAPEVTLIDNRPETTTASPGVFSSLEDTLPECALPLAIAAAVGGLLGILLSMVVLMLFYCCCKPLCCPYCECFGHRRRASIVIDCCCVPQRSRRRKSYSCGGEERRGRGGGGGGGGLFRSLFWLSSFTPQSH